MAADSGSRGPGDHKLGRHATERASTPLCALLLVALAALQAGCGVDVPVAARPPTEAAPAPRRMEFDQVPHTSLLALPGGLLTELMESETKREAGSFLKTDDPLHDDFLERADKRFETLTWNDERIASMCTDDAVLAELWKKARSKPRVSDWRPNPDGGQHVVVELDMEPLYRHLKKAHPGD